MSFSNFGNGPDASSFFGRRGSQKRSGDGGKGKGKGDGPGRKPTKANASSQGNGNGGLKGGARGRGMSARNRPLRGGGQCPLRALGPLAGLLPTTASGNLRCPAPITKMRGFVASLGAVRGLRPHTLPVRGAALVAVAMLGNVPAGMLREHTTKFSPAWFLAVHFAVPFVAMLRKAVLLPQWALLLTVAGSMAGQVAGSRFERARMSGNLPKVDLARLILPPEEDQDADKDGQTWPAFAAVSPATTAKPTVVVTACA